MTATHLQAIQAMRQSYKLANYVSGNSEGLLIDYGDGPLFGCRGTTFDGWAIVFRDPLIDGLAYPWRSSTYPQLGWCHKGFLRGRWFGKEKGAIGLFRLAFADLMAQRNLVLYGHSKGGAEAAIIAGLLVIHGRPPAAIITCGQPMVAASSHLGRLLEGIPYTRYVHGSDIVPKMPPFGSWWRHNREEHRLVGGRGLALSDKFKDHKIAAYEAAYKLAHARR